MRIVSLLPSATEILFALGAGEQVVGVTFECDFPPEARSRRIVSDTTLPPDLTPAQIDEEVRARVGAGEDLYTLDKGALRELGADLVVTQDLCAVCAVDVSEVDDALEHLGCRARVLTLDPTTLDEVLESIIEVGRATGAPARAREVVAGLRDQLARVADLVAGRARPRLAVLEWTDPPYSPGHWIPDLVSAAGAVPVLGDPGGRSAPIDWVDLEAAGPDLIVVAPCGYGLDDALRLAGDLVSAGVLPNGVAVWAADANAAFVRPGPRLVDGVEALAAVAHPGVVPPRPDLLAPVAPPR